MKTYTIYLPSGKSVDILTTESVALRALRLWKGVLLQEKLNDS